MDVLQIELAKLRRDAKLKQSIEDVDKIIEQLERARGTIVAGKKIYLLVAERRKLTSAHSLLDQHN